MFKKLCLLTLLGVAQIGSLSAYLRPAAGAWGLEAEFLYFMPSFGDTYYVGDIHQAVFGTATISSSSFTKRNNDFDFIPGFRVGGAYGLCDCNELIVRYSRLSKDQNDTTTGLLFQVQGRLPSSFFNGTASSDLDLLYQNVDLLYGFGAYNGCKLNLDVQGGLEFAYIRLNENVVVSGLPNGGTTPITYTNRAKEKTWGIGPQLGFDLSYDFSGWCGLCDNALAFVSRASGSLLVSETTFNQNSTSNVGYYIVSDESTWRMVPAVHARLGLNYATCFSCVNAAFEIGYEFNCYIDGFMREKFTDGAAALNNNAYSFSQFTNFGTNGLYVSAGVTF